jgi:AraC-like DNA-binding protein/mannose-6-phosphate isomerase-like protein (cupin superfamily)
MSYSALWDAQHNTQMVGKAQFEKVPSGPDEFFAYERCEDEFRFSWHYHPEYELTLISEGSGQRLVGDGTADYGPGDLVLLGPNLPHTWKSVSPRVPGNTKQRATVIQFRAEHLGGVPALEGMRPLAHLLERSKYGLHFDKKNTERAAPRLVKIPGIPSGYRTLELLNILLELADKSRPVALSTGQVLPLCRLEDQKKINEICTYLDRHSNSSVDFGHLAQKIHMDQASLCRFFKRASGRTMTTYLTEVRISNATSLLLDTDLSILEIAFRVGFGNYSNFCRQFRRIKGRSPRDLRKLLTN